MDTEALTALETGPLTPAPQCRVPRTIHAANTTEWKPGDLVIHDDDAKRPDMLMVVLGRIKSGSNAGKYRTRYVNTDGCAARGPMHQYRRTVWKNDISRLHDPARFGMASVRSTRTKALA